MRVSMHKYVSIVVSLLLISFSCSSAQFALDFEKFSPGPGESLFKEAMIDCNFTGTASCDRGSGSWKDPDTTPFFVEVVRLATGDIYYHAIIGDPDTDFAMEYYIRAGWGLWDSWGNVQSASSGGYNGGADAKPGSHGASLTWFDPLHSTMAGNGSGAPNRTAFRLKLNNASNGFSQDVLKDRIGLKPKITQHINQDELISNFVADMTNSTYTDSMTPAVMTNTMIVKNALTNEIYSDFDISDPNVVALPADVPNTSRVINLDATAGRYTHGDGVLYRDMDGTYTYHNGSGFNEDNFNWSTFRDPNVNVPNF